MAYEQLLSEGYIESIPCKGYFVSRIEELVITGQENGGESPFFGTYPWEVPGDSHPAAGEAEYKVDFSPRGVDLDSFPFNTWRKISRNTGISWVDICAATTATTQKNTREPTRSSKTAIGISVLVTGPEAPVPLTIDREGAGAVARAMPPKINAR